MVEVGGIWLEEIKKGGGSLVLQIIGCGKLWQWVGSG